MSGRGGGGHASEWVSFSDLMAGTVAVVILLFIAASINASSATAARRAQEARQLRELHTTLEDARRCQRALDQAGLETDRRKNPIRVHLARLKRELHERGEAALDIDLEQLRITLTDPDDRSTYATSSACIGPSRRAAIDMVAGTIREILRTSDGVIHIEGHTDSARFPSQPRDREQCLVAGDNFILSAQRALEVRRRLVESGGLLGNERRIVLAAYGDTRPLYPDSRDRRNRRIVIEARLDAPTPAQPAAAPAGSR